MLLKMKTKLFYSTNKNLSLLLFFPITVLTRKLTVPAQKLTVLARKNNRTSTEINRTSTEINRTNTEVNRTSTEVNRTSTEVLSYLHERHNPLISSSYKVIHIIWRGMYVLYLYIYIYYYIPADLNQN